jgi:two-component system CAI-1 autoinducer sensor kinase/phosphatase CqsS
MSDKESRFPFRRLAGIKRMILHQLFVSSHAEEAHANRLIMLGWLALIGFPLYYWIWHAVFPQPYENLTLRCIGVIIMVPCLFARKLRTRRWFSTYFFVAVTYVFPFFFTFMFLKNGGSAVWAQSMLIAMIVLFHFETRVAFGAFAAGVAAAVLADVASGGVPDWPDEALLSNLPIIAFAILSVSIVKTGRRLLMEEKLRGMASALGTVAHELRTPLRSMDANARGLKRYLPVLTSFYEQNGSDSDARVLSPPRVRAIDAAVERIQAEVRHMNSTIDLLLANASEATGAVQSPAGFSINDVIVEAIRRYPFESEQQRALVKFNLDCNGMVEGNADLCMMVLFNLLKNALRAIARAGKGEIMIATHFHADGCRLKFRDSGCGIPTAELPYVFRRFYSYPANAGTGIGLAFCRTTLDTWGATITCHSKENVYTEFNIQFRRADLDAGAA